MKVKGSLTSKFEHFQCRRDVFLSRAHGTRAELLLKFERKNVSTQQQRKSSKSRLQIKFYKCLEYFLQFGMLHIKNKNTFELINH